MTTNTDISREISDLKAVVIDANARNDEKIIQNTKNINDLYEKDRSKNEIMDDYLSRITALEIREETERNGRAAAWAIRVGVVGLIITLIGTIIALADLLSKT